MSNDTLVACIDNEPRQQKCQSDESINDIITILHPVGLVFVSSSLYQQVEPAISS